MGENYTIISLLRENFWHLNPNIVIVKRTAHSAQHKQAHNHNKWNRNEADDGEKDRSIYNTIVLYNSICKENIVSVWDN